MVEESLARREMERTAAVRGFGDPRTETVPGGINCRRVRGGWLGWIDHDDPTPGNRSGIRLEMRDADNEPFTYPGWTLEWPLWPAEDIADRIDAATDDDRFPPYVQAVLETSGWFPGRAVPERHLDDLAAQFAALPIENEEEKGDEVYRPVLHDAARTALREFGALHLGAGPTGGGLHIAPDPGYTWNAEAADSFGAIFEQQFCLVGHHNDLVVLMAHDGWCLVDGMISARVGGSFDAMITFMLTHPVPFPQLDLPAEMPHLFQGFGSQPSEQT